MRSGGDPFPCPNGRCRACGHALERGQRRAGKPLVWDCTNLYCPKKQKVAAKVGGVIVTNKPASPAEEE